MATEDTCTQTGQKTKKHKGTENKLKDKEKKERDKQQKE